MLIRCRHQQSSGRKFVRFTVAITTAAIFVFLLYFHSSIDAFSLGFRTLPTSYLYNNQVSSPYTEIHSQNLLAPFSRLKTKAENYDDDEAATLDANDDRNGSGSSTPFFAEKTNLIGKIDDSYAPFFSGKMNPIQMANTNADNSNSDSPPPFFGEKEDQSIEIERKLTSGVHEESTKFYPRPPTFLSKSAFQALFEKTPETSDMTENNLMRVINVFKSLSSKVDKQTISKREQSIQKAVSSAKILLGLEKPSIESRYERSVPMTPKKEALELAGNVTTATVKVALWLGKEVGALTLIGTRLVYNNTIGPSVEEVWNEQLDNLNNTVNKATAYVKSTPSRIKAAVVSSIQQDLNSVSTSASATNDPAFVSRRKSKATRTNSIKTNDRKNENNFMNPMVKNILKSPGQLSKEREEDEKLANEISDALDVAERALSNSDDQTEKMNDDNKNENYESKPEKKIVWNTPEELNKAFEGAQESAKENEIPDALDVTERALSNSDDQANKNYETKLEKMIVLNSPEELNEALEEAQESAKENQIPGALDMVERTLSSSNHKNEDSTNDASKENLETKAGEKAILKTSEILNKELQEAQELAKEISNALDVAERALKLNLNIDLEDPMIEIGKLKSIDNTEVSVTPSPSPPSFWKKKITRAQKRKQRKEKRKAMQARARTAKTQDDLDAELIEAQSLAKEIADALDIAEQALKMVPANTNSSSYDIDEEPGNLTP